VIPGQEKEIIFGPFYFIYVVYILSFFLLAFIRLFKKYCQVLRKKDEKNKIKKAQIVSIFFWLYCCYQFGFCD